MDSGTGKPEGGLGADCRSLVQRGGDGQDCVLGTSEVGVGLTVAHGMSVRVRMSSGPWSKLSTEGEVWGRSENGCFPSFPPSVPSLNNFNWVPTTCQRFVTYCCVTDGWARTPAFCSRSSQGCPGAASVLGEGIDRGAWEAAVHGVPESPTRLSTYMHAGHETYLLFSDHLGWFMGDCVHKSPALPHTSLFLEFGLLHRRLLVFPNSAGTSFHLDDLLTGDIVHSTPCFCCCLLRLDGEGLQSSAMPCSPGVPAVQRKDGAQLLFSSEWMSNPQVLEFPSQAPVLKVVFPCVTAQSSSLAWDTRRGGLENLWFYKHLSC